MLNYLSKEILDHYQIRKTKKQKERFIALLQDNLPGVSVEAGGFGNNRNIVVGDPATAKIVFGAHYDTCAVLPVPNMIMPKNLLFSLLYSLLIAIPFLVFSELCFVALLRLSDNFALSYAVSMVLLIASLFGVMMLGPPNKHTANDNTSGVIVLCELILSLSPKLRETCAFVFFDNEENGLLGSMYFHKLHKAHMKNKLLVNLDCVGDGKNMMFVLNKPAEKRFGAVFKQSFPSTETIYVLHEKAASTFYPSDQANFPVSAAVASLKKNRILGYYMNRIHTKRDIICDEANIQYLTEGFQCLVSALDLEGVSEP